MSRFVKLTFNWHKTSTERASERARDAPRASCAADTQKQISINTHEQSCHHAQMPIEMTTATTTMQQRQQSNAIK